MTTFLISVSVPFIRGYLLTSDFRIFCNFLQREHLGQLTEREKPIENILDISLGCSRVCGFILLEFAINVAPKFLFIVLLSFSSGASTGGSTIHRRWMICKRQEATKKDLTYQYRKMLEEWCRNGNASLIRN